MSSWKEEARRHLESCYPKEGCGLVVETSDGLAFHAVQNRAQVPEQHFVIDPADYAAAEDRGRVTCLVHSHPDYPARPSEADLTMCEGSGLEWLIVRVDGAEGPPTAGEEQLILPSGYRAPLVGRQFFHGVLDCFALIRDWFAWERGVELPDYRREDRWWETEGEGTPNLYMENFRDAGFEQVTDGSLLTGDVVLMQVRSTKVNHAGIYLGPSDGRILHHLYGRLSTRDVYGGYWLDRTRLIVRHPEGNK